MKDWIIPLAPSIFTSAAFAQGTCTLPPRALFHGSGTVGTLGVPTLKVVGAPAGQRTFALKVRKGTPGGLGLIVYSLGSPEVPPPLAPHGGVFYPSGSLGTLLFPMNAQGVSPNLFYSSFLDPQICGLQGVLQVAVLDAKTTGGVSLSKGMELEVWGHRDGRFGDSVSAVSVQHRHCIPVSGIVGLECGRFPGCGDCELRSGLRVGAVGRG